MHISIASMKVGNTTKSKANERIVRLQQVSCALSTRSHLPGHCQGSGSGQNGGGFEIKRDANKANFPRCYVSFLALMKINAIAVGTVEADCQLPALSHTSPVRARCGACPSELR